MGAELSENDDALESHILMQDYTIVLNHESIISVISTIVVTFHDPGRKPIPYHHHSIIRNPILNI